MHGPLTLRDPPRLTRTLDKHPLAVNWFNFRAKHGCHPVLIVILSEAKDLAVVVDRLASASGRDTARSFAALRTTAARL
jgi:hypothetical protein